MKRRAALKRRDSATVAPTTRADFGFDPRQNPRDERTRARSRFHMAKTRTEGRNLLPLRACPIDDRSNHRLEGLSPFLQSAVFITGRSAPFWRTTGASRNTR